MKWMLPQFETKVLKQYSKAVNREGSFMNSVECRANRKEKMVGVSASLKNILIRF